MGCVVCVGGGFGVDTTIENWRAETASDMMDVSTVHRRAVAAHEASRARVKISQLSGLIQVRRVSRP